MLSIAGEEYHCWGNNYFVVSEVPVYLFVKKDRISLNFAQVAWLLGCDQILALTSCEGCFGAESNSDSRPFPDH